MGYYNAVWSFAPNGEKNPGLPKRAKMSAQGWKNTQIENARLKFNLNRISLINFNPLTQ